MNQSTRIAILIPKLDVGGAERVVLNLLKGMLKTALEIEIDLVLASAEGQWLNEIPSEIRVVNLKTPFGPTLKTISRVTFPLAHYLRTEKPDVVLSNLWYYNVFAVIAVALARITTRLILIEHGSFSPLKKFPRRTMLWLLPLLMRYLYPYANYIVTVSKGLAQELTADLNLKPSLIKTIYNPVIDERLYQGAQQSVTHPWFNDREIPVILGVGRLSDIKNFPTLIRAFALVLKQQPARLVILGDGEDKPKLIALVRELGLEDNVALLGFLDNPYAYMARSHVFVLSSASEAFGNVIVESLALGTPVVSTNCPNGPDEILDNGKYGELVSVGDSEAMAQAILRVLSGNYKSVEPGWLEQFTLASVTHQYLDIIGIRRT
ncbi:MAG TPA: glycosyl transferase [Cyanobacteria bacterium UBA8803]|nr:glycosyl transferase [Cyanobacteria bacterium UBA9273]HBL62740.1 glycosyl transferase [Cyanobacteria bacterium UBA8803]